MVKIKNYRWWIAAMLMVANALNYLDRQNMPMVITELRKVFPIDDITFSQLNFMFLLAYGIMYIGGGKIIDWLGPRVGLDPSSAFFGTLFYCLLNIIFYSSKISYNKIVFRK